VLTGAAVVISKLKRRRTDEIIRIIRGGVQERVNETY